MNACFPFSFPPLFPIFLFFLFLSGNWMHWVREGGGRRCVTLLQEVGKTATLLPLPLSLSPFLSCLKEEGSTRSPSLFPRLPSPHLHIWNESKFLLRLPPSTFCRNTLRWGKRGGREEGCPSYEVCCPLPPSSFILSSHEACSRWRRGY